MAEKTIAVVTAGNKGIGFETCRKLACTGVTVILTGRNEKNGIEVVEKLKASGLEDVVFHPLDIKDSASIASLAKFVETHYKKLDILVNNAGQMGDIVDFEKFRSIMGDNAELGLLVNDDNVHLLDGIVLQPHDKAKECLETNYYGTKNVTEALLPLLQLSKSPRIVNVSSILGLLIFIHSEGIKAELSNVETLTEAKIDVILQQFLKDLKDNNLKANGWPLTAAAYKISKAAVNAYTRFMAKKYPNISINCVHPGFVNTDMTFRTGPMTPEEGARGPAFVALLPEDGPSGRYFDMTKVADY